MLPKPSNGISVTKKQSEKHDTLSSHPDVRRLISTKFCIMTEYVRAIIASLTFFDPIGTLAARRHRKFG